MGTSNWHRLDPLEAHLTATRVAVSLGEENVIPDPKVVDNCRPA